ncbi:glycoside hydrolase family 25 protein [uncultured Oscillibacter sp.]|uniref:glycoside hydrolase family 25 protein n=1 Tax=uncultured Oscillibacter sp. TaxID=876091 RepID=UPI0025D40B47|nr:glycoside hydrolase family 25 protein [uncultured Oscillibacter sp.]
MNDSLSGADLRERELAGRSRGEAPPAKDGRPAPSRAPQRPRWSGPEVLSLAISILALIVAGTALCLVLRGYEGPEGPSGPPEDEPVTFRFGDMVLTPLEGMPLAPYDKDAFGRDEKGRVTYEADGRRAKAGIDVSTHQKDIDWPSVAADGIDFAILRLGHRGYTEGGLFLDQTFEQNLRGALDAGLEAGVYFFSQAVTPEEAEEEADYVLEVLDGQALSFPVAFDWEPIPGDEARTDGLDGETMTRCAAAFCKRIEDAGYRAAVYFNQTQGYLRYDLRELTDYALWLAEYDAVPDFYYHFDLWQYSHTGRVDGIQGDVDLDLAF